MAECSGDPEDDIDLETEFRLLEAMPVVDRIDINEVKGQPRAVCTLVQGLRASEER